MSEDNDALLFNDAPISSPEEDAFGLSPFAEALAEAFCSLDHPVGATIGLNGPWGSGKTSAVNLVRHHISKRNADLTVVEFKCWWFRGDEALTLAFLQELKSSFEASLGDQAKRLFGQIGRKLLQAGPVVGPVVGLATGGMFGGVADGATKVAERLFPREDRLEKMMQDLAEALAKQTRRYLVIIDDIDRLAPDEALQVFKLIKSVGRLPNVMYLAVFDRALADKAARDRYPSEGPQFLEKIIQASFELPVPSRNDLYNAALRRIQAACGVPHDDEMQRFWNVFYGAIAPYITLPRHVVRLANAMSVTWPPLRGEVNIADYVALEAMRLSEPAVYEAVRNNGERLWGARSGFGNNDDADQHLLDELVGKASEASRSFMSEALQRLFPRLENVGYAGDFVFRWDAQRLVCSERHFDKYFRLTLGDGVMSSAAVTELIEHAADDSLVRERLRSAAAATRRNGQSRIPVLFDELQVHADRVAVGDVQPLLATLFSMADEIDLQRDLDRSSGFGIGTHMRLHWLLRRLTEARPLIERSSILLGASRGAPVGWLADFVSSAYRDYHPRDGEEPEREEKCLLREEDLGDLQRLFLARVADAAANRSLLAHQHIGSILFRWYEFGSDEERPVKTWLARVLQEDSGVAAIAKAFTSESYTQGMGGFAGLGDRVARRIPRAAVEGMDKLLDVPAFRARLNELARDPRGLSPEEQEDVLTLVKAWDARTRGED